MSLLMDATLKASFLLLVALAAVVFLRRRSAALRHWILAAAILGAALAPMLWPIAPAWYLPLRPPSAVERPAAAPPLQPRTGPATGEALTRATPGETPTKTPLNATRLLALTWAGGVAVSVLALLAGVVKLSRLVSNAGRPIDGRRLALSHELCRSTGLKRPVAILESDHPSLPATWGFLHPKVVLPREALSWSDERFRIVLLHELAHIQRGDWLTQLAADCVRAVYWFNPLLWIASRRLRQESEHACDDAVLREGIDAPDYASHLLALARAATARRRAFFGGFIAPAMARPSSLERRFSAMLNSRLNRTPLTRRARVTTAITVLLITVLVAGFGAQTFSSFSGAVFDSTNRVLPGVKLTLLNLQSRAKYEIESDGAGRFEFVGLPRGEYAWETSLVGFAKTKGTVTVGGQNILRDLTLQVGSLSETITIRGGTSSAAASAGATNDGQNRNVDAIRQRRLAKPCAAGAIGGTISAPTKLVDVAPRYPVELNAAKVAGVVILEVTVDTKGDVRDVSVLHSPHPGLEQAAIDAVRQWQYTPTLLNCVPVEVHMNVTAAFMSQP